MLVLTRKTHEEILIGDGIKVTIVKVQGQQVQIGIDAPVDVPVHRREVADRIRREAERGDRTGDFRCREAGAAR